MVKVFYPSAAAADLPRKTTTAPAAAEPANNSRRETALMVKTFFCICRGELPMRRFHQSALYGLKIDSLKDHRP